ncbi:hypothetical protein V8C42DRAFT_326022 [Trichoderma barbatum]
MSGEKLLSLAATWLEGLDAHVPPDPLMARAMCRSRVRRAPTACKQAIQASWTWCSSTNEASLPERKKKREEKRDRREGKEPKIAR